MFLEESRLFKIFCCKISFSSKPQNPNQIKNADIKRDKSYRPHTGWKPHLKPVWNNSPHTEIYLSYAAPVNIRAINNLKTTHKTNWKPEHKLFLNQTLVWEQSKKS